MWHNTTTIILWYHYTKFVYKLGLEPEQILSLNLAPFIFKKKSCIIQTYTSF